MKTVSSLAAMLLVLTAPSAWAIAPNEVRICAGPALDGTCVTLGPIGSFHPEFIIKSVEVGEDASLRHVGTPGRPSYSTFLPINGEVTTFLDIWDTFQGSTDMYSVEPPPQSDDAYLYTYRTSAPNAMGVLYLEGSWNGINQFEPYGGYDGGILSSAAAAGQVLTPQGTLRIVYGGQELTRPFKFPNEVSVVNQWETDMVGSWVQRVGGGGGGGEFAVFTGYEYSEENVSIDRQIDSITAKASVGFKFGPVGGGTSVTGTTAREQTKQTTERTARSTKQEVRWTCPPPSGDYNFLTLYQWELSGKFAVSESLSSPDSYVDTVANPTIFHCVYARTAPALRAPQCVPILCKDAGCQTCCDGIDDPACQDGAFAKTGPDGAMVFTSYEMESGDFSGTEPERRRKLGNLRGARERKAST
jgi:hypothetical protein